MIVIGPLMWYFQFKYFHFQIQMVLDKSKQQVLFVDFVVLQVSSGVWQYCVAALCAASFLFCSNIHAFLIRITKMKIEKVVRNISYFNLNKEVTLKTHTFFLPFVVHERAPSFIATFMMSFKTGFRHKFWTIGMVVFMWVGWIILWWLICILHTHTDTRNLST